MTELLGQFALDWAVLQRLGYVAIFLLVSPLFPFLYLVLRWRQPTARGTGTYGALLYFRTAAILLTITGAANLTYGHFSKTPIEPELTRLSWGLFWGSLVFVAINVGLGRLVRVERPVEVRRVFLGFLMILSGLLAFFSLVMLFIVMAWEVKTNFLSMQRSDEILLFGVWTAYFLGTYIGTTVILTRERGYAAYADDAT